jgi:uncharacterized protein YndB with AHSA1/START domain
MYYRGSWEGTPYEDHGIIVAIDIPHHLAYDYRSSWDTSPDIRENYQRVEYHLSESDGVTTLTITQGTVSEEEAKKSEENWKSVMEGMRAIVEKGE